MTPRPIDLPRIQTALDALDALTAAHPELLEGDAPERLAALLEEPTDDAPEERTDGAEKGEDARPTSR